MSDLADRLQSLVDAVRAQQQSIERLVAALPASSDQKEGGADDQSEPRLINWLELRGEERRRAWQELAAFVERIVAHYELFWTVRPCWWRHNDAVEELTALWHSYQLAFADPTNLGAAMTWRDSLSRSRNRLADLFLSCREGHVDMTISAAWMPDDIRRAFHRAVQDDVDAFR
jgi:hypothetical protein